MPLKTISKYIGRGSERAKSEIEREYIRLLNKYILSISLVFLITTLYDVVNVNYVYFSPFIGLALIFAATFYTDLRFDKTMQTSICIVSSLLFFFYASYTGFESGISLYFIPLVLSLPFVFDIKRDRYRILLVLAFICLELGLNFKTDYQLFYSVAYTRQIQQQIFESSLIGSIMLILLVVYFIFRKVSILFKYYKKIRLEELASKRSNLELQLDSTELRNIVKLARERNPYFFERFRMHYPDFYEKLSVFSPTLQPSEFELCTYLKLNFTTKEIAFFMNSTERSVQARKYRIRKKFNIPKAADLNLWMMEL